MRLAILTLFTSLAAASAWAAPPTAGLPTPTRPLAQPNFAAAPTVTPAMQTLPSGPYRLTIEMPQNGQAQGRTAVDAVTLTHTGSTLTFAAASGPIGGGQTFGGTIDATGAVTVMISQGSATLNLVGTAGGSQASGQVIVNLPNVAEPPRGQFDLVPASMPQARARPNQLVEAINNLLHAIGCWAHGGAGC